MKFFTFRSSSDRPNPEIKVINRKEQAAIMAKFGKLRLKGMPPINQQAAAQNIAMTNANYAFMGGQSSWSKSASFSDLFDKPLKNGTPLQVSFPDQVFAGRLARRLCMWGDEEYLECPLPRNFTELVQGPYRRSLDVALNQQQQLVMTYTPTAVFVEMQLDYATNQYVNPKIGVPDLLTHAVKVEILNQLPPIDLTDLHTMLACAHAHCTHLAPDPGFGFLERTFGYCETCGMVQSVSGRCARDACDCDKHNHHYKSAQVCVDW